MGAGKGRDPTNNVLLPRPPCHSSDGGSISPKTGKVELGWSSCAIGESHDLMHSCYYEQCRFGVWGYGVMDRLLISSRRDSKECGLGSLILDEILTIVVLMIVRV